MTRDEKIGICCMFLSLFFMILFNDGTEETLVKVLLPCVPLGMAGIWNVLKP